MISWLKGQIINTWQTTSKKGIVLNVGGIGYEIQLLPKQIDKIDQTNSKEFWIHQIIREDYTNLFGFKELNQRDLFRKIIGVNGIGPQIAMSLLEDLDVDQLVYAIEINDLTLLTKTQGIGKRIGERLVLDLKNKLQEFSDNSVDFPDKNNLSISTDYDNYLEEIRLILVSLGYLDSEIKETIKFITINEKENTLLINSLSIDEKKDLMDKHLKEILIRLSQKSP